MTATPLLGRYPKECKSIFKRDACIAMVIAALFMVAKLLNHSWCLVCLCVCVCEREREREREREQRERRE
jgi:hypothetical protein